VETPKTDAPAKTRNSTPKMRKSADQRCVVRAAFCLGVRLDAPAQRAARPVRSGPAEGIQQ